MDADQYLNERLEKEIEWYDTLSSNNKSWYLITREIEIVCSAVIPLLAGFASDKHPCISIAMGILGVAVASAAGFASLLKFQENWIKYRTTSEALKKEKYLFQTNVEPYDSSDPFPLLVQRIETLVSQENTNWAQYMIRPEKKDEGY